MASGGSTPARGTPHTQEQFSGPNTAIADNGFAVMSWGTSSGPDSLLNVTAPTLPTIIATGTYAVTMTLRSTDITVGGYMLGQLELDVAGTDLFVGLQSWTGNAVVGYVGVLLTATWYLVAGMQVKAVVSNHDGVLSRDFNLTAYVQRLA